MMQNGKIFCIGRNKTGTTSLRQAFRDLGLATGSQYSAERLLPEYKTGDFTAIAEYCKSAQVFQDFPFSFPETFRYMDKVFPDAKFILTVRDSAGQWYKSLTTFHAKAFGNGSIPSKEDLRQADYIWKGWIWECNRLMYGSPENDPYQKEALVASYNNYNQVAIDYFKDKPGKLIVINVGKKGDYQKLMRFLGITSPFADFPWENKTNPGAGK